MALTNSWTSTCKLPILDEAGRTISTSVLIDGLRATNPQTEKFSSRACTDESRKIGRAVLVRASRTGDGRSAQRSMTKMTALRKSLRKQSHAKQETIG